MIEETQYLQSCHYQKSRTLSFYISVYSSMYLSACLLSFSYLSIYHCMYLSIVYIMYCIRSGEGSVVAGGAVTVSVLALAGLECRGVWWICNIGWKESNGGCCEVNGVACCIGDKNGTAATFDGVKISACEDDDCVVDYILSEGMSMRIYILIDWTVHANVWQSSHLNLWWAPLALPCNHVNTNVIMHAYWLNGK